MDGANDNRVRATIAGANVTGRDFVDSFPALYTVSGRVFNDVTHAGTLTDPNNRQ